MARFGERSRANLAECHPSLQDLFNEVVVHYNCAVLAGHRGKVEQNELFAKNQSKLRYPDSKHNQKPSLAADVVPWFKSPPHIRWNDRNKFYEFGGFVQGIASQMGIEIRWGGNWNRNDELDDQNFFDLPHFELR